MSRDYADELARQGRWIAFVSQETGQGRKMRLYLRWRPLVTIAVAAVFGAYLFGAVALTWWLGRRPHNQIHFADVVLPWRWSEVQTLRGQGFAAAGLDLMAAGEATKGVFLIDRGLKLQPNNAAARLAVADYYARGRYYDGVLRLLRPQLSYGYDRAVVDLLLAQARQADDFACIEEVANRFLPLATLAPEARRALVQVWAETLLEHDRPDEAASVLQAAVALHDPELTRLLVNALAEAGRADEALTVAQAAPPDRVGWSPGLRRQMLARAWRAQGDLAAMTRELTALVQQNLAAPEPLQFAILQQALAGQTALAEGLMRDYFSRFGGKSELIRQLVGRLAEHEQVQLATFAVARAEEWGAETNSLELMVVVARIARWDEAGIEQSIRRLSVPALAQVPGAISARSVLQALLELRRTDRGDRTLLTLLDRQALPLGGYRALLEGLERIDAWSTIKQVVTVAQRAYPHSALLVTWAGRATEKLGAQLPTDAMGTRVTAALAAGVAEGRDLDAATVNAERQRLVSAQNWVELQALSWRVRRAQPAWLADENTRAAWDLADAQVALGLGELLRWSQLAPRVLQRDPEAWAAMADQFRTTVSPGRKEQALAALDAVIGALPDAAGPRGLREELLNAAPLDTPLE